MAEGNTGGVSERQSSAFCDSVVDKIRGDESVHCALPGGGRLHLDRQLPFICVYRRPAGNADPQMEQLVQAEASYLIIDAPPEAESVARDLLHRLATSLAAEFNAFLFIECWEAPEAVEEPALRLVRPPNETLNDTIAAFDKALHEIRVDGVPLSVRVEASPRIAAPGHTPLLTASDLAGTTCHILGLEIPPVYRDRSSGGRYPVLHRLLHRNLSAALKTALYEFSLIETSYQPLHYHELGSSFLDPRVTEIDAALADIGRQFDYLRMVTPTNVEAAWEEFQAGGCQHKPAFRYLPYPFDPVVLKRRLFQIPVEDIHDPTLAHLFREQQMSLGRKLMLLTDRGMPHFVYGSMQLFGVAEPPLLREAEAILEEVNPEEDTGQIADAATLAQRVEEELARYRARYSNFPCAVKVDPTATGILVSRGDVYIGTDISTPQKRLDALMAHEIGTHVLTHVNGGAQPFQQLQTGLAGCDALQEGLGVFAEYLVGGVTPLRLRLLAARVVAVARLVAGASFADVFAELHEGLRFAPKTAFHTTMRVFRGGGLTKDAVYLRGLHQLLAYLSNGGALEPLYVGKISTDHVPVIEELRWRKILRPLPLRPMFLDDAAAAARLERARKSLQLVDLLK